jgi:hypothetical protein
LHLLANPFAHQLQKLLPALATQSFQPAFIDGRRRSSGLGCGLIG